MVTSRDVARAAGVSQATVSRVLRGSEHVSAHTRERVLAALEGVGYIPNAHARAMRTGRTGTIGIVMERITNPFYPELLESLAAVLAGRGQRMILWLSEGPAELSAVTAIHEGTIDGVIFTTVRQGSVALEEAIRMNAPSVLVNRTVDGLPCDQVASTNFEGSANVARYFAEHGHDRVGVICGLDGVSTNNERYSGFIAGAKAAGITVRSSGSLAGDFTHAHGYRAFERLMSQKVPPTAIFCVNDLLAFGALNGAKAAGVRVPEDVWVVGFDDIDMASWPSNSLTTVKQRLDDMANAAVELLLGRIDDPRRQPSTLRFPSQLVIRGTTDNQQFTGATGLVVAPASGRE
jgi:LacI family transcriptional regulator